MDVRVVEVCQRPVSVGGEPRGVAIASRAETKGFTAVRDSRRTRLWVENPRTTRRQQRTPTGSNGPRLCGAGETVVCVASSNSIYRKQQSSLSTLLYDDTRSKQKHIPTYIRTNERERVTYASRNERRTRQQALQRTRSPLRARHYLCLAVGKLRAVRGEGYPPHPHHASASWARICTSATSRWTSHGRRRRERG